MRSGSVASAAVLESKAAEARQKSEQKKARQQAQKEKKEEDSGPIPFDELQEGLESEDQDMQRARKKAQGPGLCAMDRRDACTYLQELITECTVALVEDRLAVAVEEGVEELEPAVKDGLPGLKSYVLKGLRKLVEKSVTALVEAGFQTRFRRRAVKGTTTSGGSEVGGHDAGTAGRYDARGGATLSTSMPSQAHTAGLFGVSGFVTGDLFTDVEAEEPQPQTPR
jgi:hypothetical protein